MIPPILLRNDQPKISKLFCFQARTDQNCVGYHNLHTHKYLRRFLTNQITRTASHAASCNPNTNKWWKFVGSAPVGARTSSRVLQVFYMIRIDKWSITTRHLFQTLCTIQASRSQHYLRSSTLKPRTKSFDLFSFTELNVCRNTMVARQTYQNNEKVLYKHRYYVVILDNFWKFTTLLMLTKTHWKKNNLARQKNVLSVSAVWWFL
jgi:hypothetical protein